VDTSDGEDTPQGGSGKDGAKGGGGFKGGTKGRIDGGVQPSGGGGAALLLGGLGLGALYLRSKRGRRSVRGWDIPWGKVGGGLGAPLFEVAVFGAQGPGARPRPLPKRRVIDVSAWVGLGGELCLVSTPVKIRRIPPIRARAWGGPDTRRDSHVIEQSSKGSVKPAAYRRPTFA